MGLAEDVQTMWSLGEGLKRRGFKERLCIQFFGALTDKERQKVWDLYEQDETIENINEISKKLKKNYWLIYGFVSTKKYHIDQPDPGKRLSEVPLIRGHELALRVADAAQKEFSLKNFYNDSVESLDKVFKSIEGSNYSPDKEDYKILGEYEYAMHMAQKMVKAGYSDNEVCDITEILDEDLERIKGNLYEK